MKIVSIDNLKRNIDNNLVDLVSPSFQYRLGVDLYEYLVQDGEEMRIDLIMQSLNISLEHMDIIMYINNIDNPLNIRKDMIILYPRENDINLFRYIPSKSSGDIEVKDKITPRPNKTTRKDPNRKKYIDEEYSLPPVVLENPVNHVRIENGNIMIGGT
jgi:hypothetical protein